MWTRYGLISTKGDSIRKFHKTLPGENAIFICPIQTATSCRLLVHYNDSRELRWQMRALWQFQSRCNTLEIRICRQKFERSSNMCWPIGPGVGGFRSRVSSE